jgi:hypothetical protein
LPEPVGPIRRIFDFASTGFQRTVSRDSRSG